LSLSQGKGRTRQVTFFVDTILIAGNNSGTIGGKTEILITTSRRVLIGHKVDETVFASHGKLVGRDHGSQILQRTTGSTRSGMCHVVTCC
jgi:hypothetical protein